MSEWYTLDASGIEELQQAIDDYGAGSGQVIDRVLHGEGADLIKRAIPPHISPSGRRWAGKAASIAGNPGAGARLSHDTGNLQVTVAARGRLGYLYFPNDGTNTKNHAGDQQFMRLGAEDATPDIIDRCLLALVEEFGR